MEDYRKIAIELGQTLISKAPETRKDVERMLPELKESEDERIKKELIEFVKSRGGFKQEYIAWIEAQGEHAKFRNKIQIGDKVTKNEDGVLVNLSQLNRVAKKDEKQGEQKPSDKVEPKFKVGDFIIYNRFGRDALYNIVKINERGYYVNMDDVPNCTLDFKDEVFMRLWTIQDANDGDVLYLQKDGKEHIIIYKGVIKERFATFVSAYCAYNGIVDAFCFADVSRYVDIAYGGIMPATKEQRDTLMKAMADAGYTFDFEKKELKKIEQKPAWSEKDEAMIEIIINDIVAIKERTYCKNVCDEEINWLESLKDRVQPQNRWKPDKAVIQILELIIQGKANPANYQATLMNLVEQLKKIK